MFKSFITRYEQTQAGELNFTCGFAMNGEDLFNILPLEVQEELYQLINDDSDIKQHFSKSNIIYLVAQKEKDITNSSEEEKKRELEEVSICCFIDKT